MNAKTLVSVCLAVLLVSVAIAPAAAVSDGDYVNTQDGEVDECMNADTGPGEDGPPGFVADLVPNVISDLIGGLPVPNFVKSFFGASTC